MNDVITIEQRGISVADTLQTMKVVQQVMQSVMKSNVHYGVIPGCKQPSLYKAGSEALLATFHISVEPEVEEIISRDERGRVLEIRYRVKCVGRHSPTGNIVGYGIGECSTGEDKYAWRRAVCVEEFEATEESMRRVKWSKYKGDVQKTEQVRVNPADMSNTVLKMAKKRAQIDMTLTTLGCSDIFAQDLEDLDDTLRENFAPEPHGDPELLKRWVDAAANATDEVALKERWIDGMKEIKAAKDMPAYAAFKAAVEARGKVLKGNAQPAVDPFVAAMDSVEAA